MGTRTVPAGRRGEVEGLQHYQHLGGVDSGNVVQKTEAIFGGERQGAGRAGQNLVQTRDIATADAYPAQ